MLPKRILSLLNPDEKKPQFSRSTTFIDGLNQAGDIFGRKFRITKPGLKRAHWAEDQQQLKHKVVCALYTAIYLDTMMLTLSSNLSCPIPRYFFLERILHRKRK